MTLDELAQRLHDRASRGEVLSRSEQAQLDEWFATQHEVESMQLGFGTAENLLVGIQAQIDAALTHLTTVTKRIQEVAAENEMLRHEIATLRQQLALFSPQNV